MAKNETISNVLKQFLYIAVLLEYQFCIDEHNFTEPEVHRGWYRENWINTDCTVVKDDVLAVMASEPVVRWHWTRTKSEDQTPLSTENKIHNYN